MSIDFGTAWEPIRTLLVVVRLAVLLLGLLITYYSVEAYRRTRAPYLRSTAMGFGVITVGVFVEGLLFEVLGLDLAVVHVVESLAIGTGFVILLVALRQ